MHNDLEFKLVKPDTSLVPFVEGFWMLRNMAGQDKEIVVLPDGRADLTFFQADETPFQIVRSGLETYPDQVTLKSGIVMFAISFRLLAIEYIFRDPIAGVLDYAERLPVDFWGFGAGDLSDFNAFCKKASAHLRSLIPDDDIDPRKRQLFEWLYASNGSISVKELSEKAFWSSRQINRYFNTQFGLSLKTYCNILRFRASFRDIKEGKLFPRADFADQSHFIKEVKKLSGVSPKELNRNKNGRFIQFSALSPE